MISCGLNVLWPVTVAYRLKHCSLEIFPAQNTHVYCVEYSNVLFLFSVEDKKVKTNNTIIGAKGKNHTGNPGPQRKTEIK